MLAIEEAPFCDACRRRLAWVAGLDNEPVATGDDKSRTGVVSVLKLCSTVSCGYFGCCRGMTGLVAGVGTALGEKYGDEGAGACCCPRDTGGNCCRPAVSGCEFRAWAFAKCEELRLAGKADLDEDARVEAGESADDLEWAPRVDTDEKLRGIEELDGAAEICDIS